MYVLLGLAWSSAPLGEELGCPGSGEEVKRERRARGEEGTWHGFSVSGPRTEAAATGASGCLFWGCGMLGASKFTQGWCPVKPGISHGVVFPLMFCFAHSAEMPRAGSARVPPAHGAPFHPVLRPGASAWASSKYHTPLRLILEVPDPFRDLANTQTHPGR